jgi:hypothetical protein
MMSARIQAGGRIQAEVKEFHDKALRPCFAAAPLRGSPLRCSASLEAWTAACQVGLALFSPLLQRSALLDNGLGGSWSVWRMQEPYQPSAAHAAEIRHRRSRGGKGLAASCGRGQAAAGLHGGGGIQLPGAPWRALGGVALGCAVAACRRMDHGAAGPGLPVECRRLGHACSTRTWRPARPPEGAPSRSGAKFRSHAADAIMNGCSPALNARSARHKAQAASGRPPAAAEHNHTALQLFFGRLLPAELRGGRGLLLLACISTASFDLPTN